MNNHKVLTHTNRIESYKEDIYMKWFDNTALTVVIIGAVNWLLIGIFRLDLIAWLFGNMSWLSRIVYTIVGLCGLYLISLFGRIGSMSESEYAQVMYLIPSRCIFYMLEKKKGAPRQEMPLFVYTIRFTHHIYC